MIKQVVEHVLKYPQHKHIIGTRNVDDRNNIKWDLRRVKPNLRVLQCPPQVFFNCLSKLESGETDVILCHIVEIATGWKTDASDIAMTAVKQLMPVELNQFKSRLRGENSRIAFFTDTSENLIDEEVPFSPYVPNFRKSLYHHD